MDVAGKERHPIVSMRAARALLVSMLALQALAADAEAMRALMLEHENAVPSTSDNSNSKWIRIPLAKASRADERRRMQQLHADIRGAHAEELSSDDYRDVRLAHQQQRVRRRLQGTDTDGSDDDDDGDDDGIDDGGNITFTNATVSKSMVYSEVPLGVGFGCVGLLCYGLLVCGSTGEWW